MSIELLSTSFNHFRHLWRQEHNYVLVHYMATSATICLLALVVDSDLGHKALDHKLLRANKHENAM